MSDFDQKKQTVEGDQLNAERDVRAKKSIDKRVSAKKSIDKRVSVTVPNSNTPVSNVMLYIFLSVILFLSGGVVTYFILSVTGNRFIIQAGNETNIPSIDYLYTRVSHPLNSCLEYAEKAISYINFKRTFIGSNELVGVKDNYKSVIACIDADDNGRSELTFFVVSGLPYKQVASFNQQQKKFWDTLSSETIKDSK